MVRILDRSATFDAVLATWRRPDDLYAVPPMEPWAPDTGCDCETDAGSCECEPPARPARRGRPNARSERVSGPAISRDNRPRGKLAEASHSLTRPSSHGKSKTGSRRSATAERRVPEEPPCVPDVTSPPPFDKFTEPDAWLAWWGDCPPSGALGPGAHDCNLEQAWTDALAFCCDELRAYVESIGLNPDDTPCNDNYVQYVWLDENCNILDAWCGFVSGFHYDGGDPPGWEQPTSGDTGAEWFLGGMDPFGDGGGDGGDDGQLDWEIYGPPWSGTDGSGDGGTDGQGTEGETGTTGDTGTEPWIFEDCDQADDPAACLEEMADAYIQCADACMAGGEDISSCREQCSGSAGTAGGDEVWDPLGGDDPCSMALC